MPPTPTNASNRWNRREFLRATGIPLALPFLASLPARLRAGATPSAEGMRMVCVGNSFGMVPEAFFPKETGMEASLPHLLEPLESMRGRFTVFSGLDHGVKGGHFAVHSYLSGVKTEEASAMPEGNISIDQRAAEHVGAASRFPSLTLGSDTGLHGGCRMCWTRSGARVPPIASPKTLFHKLFVEDAPAEKRKELERMHLQASILDAMSGEARSISSALNAADRDKLDQFLTSVRDVEQRIQRREEWSAIPKPRTQYKEPEYKGIVQDLPALYDLMVLALQTQSTRIATLEVASHDFNTRDLGLKAGYHQLSHHGKKESNIRDLLKIERHQTEQFARFLGRLAEVSADGEGAPLLDSTMILLGSGMGNGNAHTNSNLPILLAGGGFQHRGHVRQSGKDAQPLCNLYLSMLQRFGVQTESFGKSTGTLRGLDWA